MSHNEENEEKEELKSPKAQQVTYLSFLLRLSRVDNKTGWRVTLQSHANQDQLSFSSLAALFDYLLELTTQNFPETKTESPNTDRLEHSD